MGEADECRLLSAQAIRLGDRIHIVPGWQQCYPQAKLLDKHERAANNVRCPVLGQQ